MDKLQTRLALKFRINTIENPGIYGPIILHEVFRHHYPEKDTKLVQGYLQVTTAAGDVETCWHTWVTSGSDIFDINKQLAMMNDHEFWLCQFSYSVDLPLRDMDVQIDQEVVEFYNIYLDNPKTFWKTIPTMKIKNFRSKVSKSL